MDLNAFNASHADNVFQYQWGSYTLVAVMWEEVYEWSSNRYTVNHVWDYSRCRAILGGVDQDFALYNWVTYSPVFGGLEFRIKVQPSEGPGVLLSTPPAPSSYWYPGQI